MIGYMRTFCNRGVTCVCAMSTLPSIYTSMVQIECLFSQDVHEMFINDRTNLLPETALQRNLLSLTQQS